MSKKRHKSEEIVSKLRWLFYIYGHFISAHILKQPCSSLLSIGSRLCSASQFA
jgi:hypothetical protein